MDFLTQFKRLGKDSISYGISSALQKFITVLLFPIYARVLTKADFGIQDLVTTSVFVITLFLILGMDSAVMMFYYEANEENKKKLNSTFFWFEIIVSVPITSILYFFSENICSFIFNDASFVSIR